MDLSSIAALAGIALGAVTATVYILQIAESLGEFSLSTLGSARRKVLASLAECSQVFNQFYEFMRSPDDAYRAANRTGRVSLVFITVSPLALLGILFVETYLLPPLAESTLLGLLEIIVLGYPVTVFVLVALSVLLQRRNTRAAPPSNSLIFAYFELKTVDTYFLLGSLLWFTTPIREWQTSANAIIDLYNAPPLAALVIVLIIAYGGLFLFIKRVKDSGIRTMETRFYARFPLRFSFIVDITFKAGRNQPHGRVTGQILRLDDNLLLRRNDGLVQAILWKSVRTIAAAPLAGVA